MAQICTVIGSVDTQCLPLTYQFDFLDVSGAIVATMSGAATDPADASLPYVNSGTMEDFEVDEVALADLGIRTIKRTVSSGTCANYELTETVLVVSGADCCGADETEYVPANASAWEFINGGVAPTNAAEIGDILIEQMSTVSLAGSAGTSTNGVTYNANDIIRTYANGDVEVVEVMPDATITGTISGGAGGAGSASAGTVIELLDANGGKEIYLSDGDGGTTLVGCKAGDPLVLAQAADEAAAQAAADTAAAGVVNGTIVEVPLANGDTLYYQAVNGVAAPTGDDDTQSSRVEIAPDDACFLRHVDDEETETARWLLRDEAQHYRYRTDATGSTLSVNAGTYPADGDVVLSMSVDIVNPSSCRSGWADITYYGLWNFRMENGSEFEIESDMTPNITVPRLKFNNITGGRLEYTLPVQTQRVTVPVAAGATVTASFDLIWRGSAGQAGDYILGLRHAIQAILHLE